MRFESNPIGMVDNTHLRDYYHDIRGPIRNIASFLQIIRSELNDDSLVYYIESAMNCLSILDEFSNSYFFPDKTSSYCCLDEIVEKVKCVLLNQILERNCKFVIGKKLGVVSASSNDVFRIFKNLIENSLRHAVSNSLEIEISSVYSSGRLTVLYADNGQWLDMQKVANAMSGCGCNHLGLRIISSLMEKNIGHIEIINKKFNLEFWGQK